MPDATAGADVTPTAEIEKPLHEKQRLRLVSDEEVRPRSRQLKQTPPYSSRARPTQPPRLPLSKKTTRSATR